MHIAIQALIGFAVFTACPLPANALEENLRDGYIKGSSRSCYQKQKADLFSKIVSDSFLHRYCDCYAEVSWSKLDDEDLAPLQNIAAAKQPVTQLPGKTQAKFKEASQACIMQVIKSDLFHFSN